MTLRRLALLLLGAMLLGPTAGRAEPPLVVGALLAVTGPASFLGAPEARSLEFLVADLNAKGGIAGRQVKLVVKDTGASPEKAVSMARQLIDEEQAFAIIGPSTSGESMAVKPIAQEAKVLLLSCAAAEAIVNPVASWVFKTAQKDSDAIAQVFAAMKRQKVTRIGLLSSNTGFGKAGKDQVEKLAPAAGITVVASEVYDKAATDLSAPRHRRSAQSRPSASRIPSMNVTCQLLCSAPSSSTSPGFWSLGIMSPRSLPRALQVARWTFSRSIARSHASTLARSSGFFASG